MHRARLLVLLLSACSSSQRVVGGHCSYEAFHGTCRFVALDHSVMGRAWADYALDGGGQVTVELSIDTDRFPAFEAHLRAHPVLACHGERLVTGSCVPTQGNVEIPAFDGAIAERRSLLTWPQGHPRKGQS